MSSKSRPKANQATERSPLLSHPRASDPESDGYSYSGISGAEEEESRQLISLTDSDPENPRNWKLRRKYTNVAIIASMAILSPLASSMFTPGISHIASDLRTTDAAVVGATSGFVVALGIGPMILAPLSETFGRRKLYIWGFSIFSVLQIPTALSPNLACLVICRTIGGFFGSVGVANGGGTLSDMFPPSERAGVFGWYLLGPVLGPTIGPLFGGFVVEYLGWRYVFWVLTVVSGVNTLSAFFFLRETYVPVLLSQRKQLLEKESGTKFYFKGEDNRSLRMKIGTSIRRPIKILFTQPIVFTMASYQALLMGTMYSLYTQFPTMFESSPYNFSAQDIGLVYLFPGSGFLFAVLFLVPRVDTVFNALTRKHGGIQKPEYRLPLANIGAVSAPLALFYFGWMLQYQFHWAACLASMPFFGVGVQMVFNTVQNYYIDTFERYAASAIAAGSFFRSIVGGVIPLLTPALFDALGYGWGVSVLGFLSVLIAPAPIVFYYYGERLRTKFAIEMD